MGGGKRHRRGTLSPEDRALWESVTRSVAPLKSKKTRRADAAFPQAGAPSPVDRPTTPAAPSVRPLSQPVLPHRPPSQPGLDRRTRQRLARGTIAIDARIDLHGMTQRQAHTRLKSFIAGCQLRGDRHVLVITGKGGPPASVHDHGERGVLRRVVPHWLGQPEFRVFVTGFEEAHSAHGGDGAFYVRLRRRAPKPSR